MPNPKRRGEITVSQRTGNTKQRNEYYRLARLARATAWQRVHGTPISQETQ